MWRTMRRSGQELSHQECLEVVASGRRGVLAVLGDEGYPYAVPLNYVFEDGHFFFHGAREGHKFDAIASCDKASLCVLSDGERTEGQWWLTFRSVVAFGRIHLIEDRDRAASYLAKMGEHHYPSDYEDIDQLVEASLPRVAVFELEVEHMTGKLVREK